MRLLTILLSLCCVAVTPSSALAQNGLQAGGSNFFIYQAGACLNYQCGTHNADSLKPWVRVYHESGVREEARIRLTRMLDSGQRKIAVMLVSRSFDSTELANYPNGRGWYVPSNAAQGPSGGMSAQDEDNFKNLLTDIRDARGSADDTVRFNEVQVRHYAAYPNNVQCLNSGNYSAIWNENRTFIKGMVDATKTVLTANSGVDVWYDLSVDMGGIDSAFSQDYCVGSPGDMTYANRYQRDLWTWYSDQYFGGGRPGDAYFSSVGKEASGNTARLIDNLALTGRGLPSRYAVDLYAWVVSPRPPTYTRNAAIGLLEVAKGLSERGEIAKPVLIQEIPYDMAEARAGVDAWTGNLNLVAIMQWPTTSDGTPGIIDFTTDAVDRYENYLPRIGARRNFALSRNGGSASASSTFPWNPFTFANDGVTTAERGEFNNFWADDTENDWSNDVLTVAFDSPKTIDEVDVYSVQDDYGMAPPTSNMAGSQHVLKDFTVEYQRGGANWITVPGGDVTGNDRIWRQFAFAPLAAVTGIRIRILSVPPGEGWSRIADLQAWGTDVDTGQLPTAFSKTTPVSGSTSLDPGGIALGWQASGGGVSSYEYCVDRTDDNACDGSWASTAALGAMIAGLSDNTTYYWQVRAVNQYGMTGANAGAWWSFTTGRVTRRNVAAAANGATALASSFHSAGYAPSGAIDGERSGVNWGGGSGWNDATANQWPDWLEVDFGGAQTIDEIDVFSVQDNYQAPSTPTLGQTFTLYGVTDFLVQTWNGTQWVTVPGGAISGNNQLWRQLTFPALTTTKIRVWVTKALNVWSRITEIEAYMSTGDAGQPPVTFAKTTPVSGSTSLDPGGIALGWQASGGVSSYEYCVDRTDDNDCDGSWASTEALGATIGGLSDNTTYYWQVRAVNRYGMTDANAGAWWSFTTGRVTRLNVAAAAKGATALASSFHSAGYAPSGAIDGERSGVNWGGGSGWNDATAEQWPDWLEVDFAGAQTIDEIDVFSVQDNYQSPSSPTLGQMFTLYGVTDFLVQTWNGTQWVTVPGGAISGNDQVWRQLTFPALTTTKIRVWVTGALNVWSRIAEIEAYTSTGGN